jgi:hypothetical protein
MSKILWTPVACSNISYFYTNLLRKVKAKIGTQSTPVEINYNWLLRLYSIISTSASCLLIALVAYTRFSTNPTKGILWNINIALVGKYIRRNHYFSFARFYIWFQTPNMIAVNINSTQSPTLFIFYFFKVKYMYEHFHHTSGLIIRFFNFGKFLNWKRSIGKFIVGKQIQTQFALRCCIYRLTFIVLMKLYVVSNNTIYKSNSVGVLLFS